MKREKAWLWPLRHGKLQDLHPSHKQGQGPGGSNRLEEEMMPFPLSKDEQNTRLGGKNKYTTIQLAHGYFWYLFPQENSNSQLLLPSAH